MPCADDAHEESRRHCLARLPRTMLAVGASPSREEPLFYKLSRHCNAREFKLAAHAALVDTQTRQRDAVAPMPGPATASLRRC